MTNTPNNLFLRANKELCTDAFLAWLFTELDTNPRLNPYIGHVFSALGLVNRGEEPQGVKVDMQNEKVDLLLTFAIDGQPRKILFENKTWSSIHSDQLNRYQGKFPDCDKYIFLKLGFIDAAEQAEINSEKKRKPYTPLTASELHHAIKGLSPHSQIIEQYCEFLEIEFIQKINRAIERAESTDPAISASSFESGIAQKYMIGNLYKDLTDSPYPVRFKSGTNVGGTPWTQLRICHKSEAYGQHGETLFWRVDRRARKTYLRLSQYSAIPKGQENLAKLKRERLKDLRKRVKTLCEKYRLKPGKTTDKGIRESEVIIFFFEETPYAQLRDVLPQLTREIQDAYASMDTSPSSATGAHVAPS